MKQIKLLFWIEALFCLGFGLYLVFQPELALKTIIFVCAIYAIVSGLVGFVFAIRGYDYQDRFLLGVISVFSAVFGVLLLCFPQVGETILKIFVSLIGIGIVVKGSFLIADSISVKKFGAGNWFGMMAMGCLLVLLGVFMELNGVMTVLIFNVLIGVCLIGAGIAMLVRSFQVKKVVKEVKKGLENGEVVEIEIK